VSISLLEDLVSVVQDTAGRGGAAVPVPRRVAGKWVSEIWVPRMWERLWLGSHAVPEAAAIAPAAAVAHAAAACLLCGLQSRGTEEGRGVWCAERMIGGARLSVEKIEVQFTQPAGVKAHIWASKI